MKKIFITTILLNFIFINYCFAQDYNVNLPLLGESIANRQLQYDTLRAVYMAVGTKTTGCGNMKITDTKVTKPPYNLKYRGEKAVEGFWEELWTVNACSEIYNVPVKFMLDETGASYMVSPKNIYSSH